MLIGLTSTLVTTDARSATATCENYGGQTFILWDNQIPVSNEIYRYQVYRQTTAFVIDENDNTVSIDDAVLIGEAKSHSSKSTKMDTATNPGGYIRLDELSLIPDGTRLDDSKGLFVTTIGDEDVGTNYYAVVPEQTDAAGNRIDKLLDEGRVFLCNTNDNIGIPSPLYQGTPLNSPFEEAKAYLLFAPEKDTSLVKAMANMPNVPIAFALTGDLNREEQPLIVGFHARSGGFNQPYQHFMPGVAQYLPDEPHITLYMQDNTQHLNERCQGLTGCANNTILNNSFWYGYPEEIANETDISGRYYCTADDVIASKGSVTIKDYTLQTTLFLINHVKNLKNESGNSVVDSNRVYSAGHSMAAIGAILTSIWAPEHTFSAVYGHAPKLNFSLHLNPSAHGENSGVDAWNTDSLERCYGNAMWGSVADENELCTDNKISNDANCKIKNTHDQGFYSTTMNAPNLVRHLDHNKDLPPIYIFAGKQDPVTNFSGKPDVLDAFNDTNKHAVFYWDNRSHSTIHVLEPHNSPEELLSKHNSSTPHLAFSNFRFDPDLPKDDANVTWPGDSTWDSNGNPLAGVENIYGSPYGSINGFVRMADVSEDSGRVSATIALQPLYRCTLVTDGSLCKCVDSRAGICTLYPPEEHAQVDGEVDHNGFWSTPILPSEEALVDLSPRNLSAFELVLDGTTSYGWRVIDSNGLEKQKGCAPYNFGTITAEGVQITSTAHIIEFYADNSGICPIASES